MHTASQLSPHLKQLESESIYILREVVAEFKKPVMLYSVGKDSSVMLRLAQKAFYPAKIPFPLLHIDTGYKFPEMYSFRDAYIEQIGAELIVERNEAAIAEGTHPDHLGTDRCCQLLKTQGLLDALNKHGFDAAFGGARREEEKSRAKERIFSVRDSQGQWDPKNQRPELWSLYNSRLRPGESVRVFPLSNWTELDIWEYIRQEAIPVVPLYFSHQRTVVARGDILIPQYDTEAAEAKGSAPESEPESAACRFRSLGCVPCTGAIRSTAHDLDAIIHEVVSARRSERENRVIDRSGESAMEEKKREGYF